MLRRLACLLIVIFIFCGIVACKKCGRSEQPVTTGFSCDIDVNYQDMKVKGVLTRTLAGTLNLDISEPETLKGMSMQLNGEKITLKLHGLSFDVNPDLIPQSALGKTLLGILDAAIGNHDAGEVTDNGLLTKGSAVSGEFEILSDPETGRLLTISMPSSDLVAEFSNFSVISD